MANAQSRPVFEALATRQWHDYQRRTPGTYFAEAWDTLTMDEAYAVQMEVARLRCAAGDAVVGYKVGCIGSGVRRGRAIRHERSDPRPSFPQ